MIMRQTGVVRGRQKPEAIANVRGLYSTTQHDREKDGSLEGTFAREIEGPAIHIINNATSVFPYVPVGHEREIMAYYVVLQYLRTPEAKRRFELDAGRLASIELFNTANNPKEIRKYLKSKNQDASDESVAKHRDIILKGLDGGEIVPNGNAWLSSIADGLEHLLPTLLQRYRWHIFYYDSISLITSDHPVILRQITRKHRGTGFANADEIMFPLSKRHALILSTDQDLEEGVHVITDPKSAEMLNDLIALNSYLEIYCSPSLSSVIAGKPLGKKTLVTMSGGITSDIDFLKKYSGELERDNPLRS